MRCGADPAVESPVQWAVSSAESFARGGVQILHALGVTHLAFGSESGDLTALQIVAQALDSAAFPDALRPYWQQGLPFASARQKALETLVEAETAEHLTRPNNLLGIEYLRAIQTLAPEMRALTVPRVGAATQCRRSASGVRVSVSASAVAAGGGAGSVPVPRCRNRRRRLQSGRSWPRWNTTPEASSPSCAG